MNNNLIFVIKTTLEAKMFPNNKPHYLIKEQLGVMSLCTPNNQLQTSFNEVIRLALGGIIGY
jgi:hypothetical protein